MTYSASPLDAVVRPAQSPRRARRRWAVLWLCGAPGMAGCYSTQPMQVAPAPGTTVLLDLNDRARIALGDRIGPSAAQIEGELTERTDSTYSVRIESVHYLNGQTNRWSGEQFTVRSDLVGQAWQRDFSRARTIGLAAGATVGLVALIAGLKLVGFGGGDAGGNNPPPPPGGS